MTVSCYTLLIRYTYGKEHKQGGIMEIYSIKDEKFRRYGKVWSGFDCTRLIREMEHTPLPEDVIYVPSMEELEVLPEACHKDERKFHVKPVRQKWFGCACCPPNLARLISSIGSYAFTENEDTLF